MLRGSAIFECAKLKIEVKSSKLLYIVSLIAFVLVANVESVLAQKNSVNDFLTLRLNVIMADDNFGEEGAAVSMLSQHISKLEKIRSRNPNEVDFLSAIFFRTHRKFLKDYGTYSAFDEMINQRNYSCLSGTMLYSILLDYFEFDYSAVELTNHIYLEVAGKAGKTYVFESTDPINGFGEIGVRADNLTIGFLADNGASEKVVANATYEFSEVINSGLSLEEMTGLQYYNQAVLNLSEKKYLKALKLIDIGIELYDSQRTRNMKNVIVSEIMRSDQIINETKELVKKSVLLKLPK